MATSQPCPDAIPAGFLRPWGVRMPETPKPADCPHSWADHCPGKRACTWRRCVVPGCRHVEDRNDPDRCYDNPAPTPREQKP